MNDERINKAVELRLDYDRVIAEVLASNDPNGNIRAGAAATVWLAAENELNTHEFLIYQERYMEAKK